MSRDRFSARPLSFRVPEPFPDAEAAWLWFWQCQLAREDGARVVADAGAVARPCDPDDVYRVAAALLRSGRLPRADIAVLARFGRALTPPDPRLRDQAAAAAAWASGLRLLEGGLRAKGIVA